MNFKNKKMKKTLLTLKIILATTMLYAAANHLHETESSLQVILINEIGEPIEGKKMFVHDDSGRGNLNWAISNSAGRVVLKNYSNAGIRVFGISGDMIRMPEYSSYYLDKGVRFRLNEKNITLNRWEPWNPEITHVIKRIKNPVSMIVSQATEMEGGRLKMSNEPEIEYQMDLLAHDWLPPYGNGKIADVAITLLTSPNDQLWNKSEAFKAYISEEEIKNYKEANDYDFKYGKFYPLRIKMKFLRKGDGIAFDSDAKTKWKGGSILWHRHEAPKTGYANEFIYDIKAATLGLIGTPYIRFRSEATDDKGENVKSAMHLVGWQFDFNWKVRDKDYISPAEAKITDARDLFFNFDYKINPNPDSLSLEWNGVDARTGKLVRENWRENQRP